jgi:hypothetical protein
MSIKQANPSRRERAPAGARVGGRSGVRALVCARHSWPKLKRGAVWIDCAVLGRWAARMSRFSQSTHRQRPAGDRLAQYLTFTNRRPAAGADGQTYSVARAAIVTEDE